MPGGRVGLGVEGRPWRILNALWKRVDSILKGQGLGGGGGIRKGREIEARTMWGEECLIPMGQVGGGRQ